MTPAERYGQHMAQASYLRGLGKFADAEHQASLARRELRDSFLARWPLLTVLGAAAGLLLCWLWG